MSSLLTRPRARAFALLAAALLAACSDPVAVVEPPDPPAAIVGPTLAWNRVVRGLVAKHATSAPASIRTFALLSVAQHDAFVAAERETLERRAASPAAAVVGASAVALSYVYPQEAEALEALARAGVASTPGTGAEALAVGEAIGRAVAAALIERAKTDRYFEPFAGTVPTCAGCWVATPTPPAFATLGQAKPYFLASNDQFRPPPPPAFGSPAFTAALAEVRRIADTRTAEQDSIAKFWALPTGTVGAQGYWNERADALATRHHLDEHGTAHALALLNMAAYDAIVTSHEAKYHYWLIRPSQADPGIQRAIGLPSFPAYPSNHSALAGAAAVVLGAVFPSERAALDAEAEEGAISRLYGGIHYRFDTDVGLALGRQVASWALAHDVQGRKPFAPR